MCCTQVATAKFLHPISPHYPLHDLLSTTPHQDATLLWFYGWHIKLITHVIILAEMKYATIYNRGYMRLDVPAVSTHCVPPSRATILDCNHFALLIKMRANCFAKSKFPHIPQMLLYAINTRKNKLRADTHR